MKKLWKLFLVFLIMLLTIADILTSQAIFSSGLGVEGNPIVSNMISFFGQWWWIPKLVSASILSIMTFNMWYGKGLKYSWEKYFVRFLIGLYVVFYISLITYHITLIVISNHLSSLL